MARTGNAPCEVFFDERGKISIRQVSGPDGRGDLVTIDPDDISDLIDMLEKVRREAATATVEEPPTARRLRPIR